MDRSVSDKVRPYQGYRGGRLGTGFVGNGGKVQLRFVATPALRRRLDFLAKQQDVTLSEVIRRACERYATDEGAS